MKDGPPAALRRAPGEPPDPAPRLSVGRIVVLLFLGSPPTPAHRAIAVCGAWLVLLAGLPLAALTGLDAHMTSRLLARATPAAAEVQAVHVFADNLRRVGRWETTLLVTMPDGTLTVSRVREWYRREPGARLLVILVEEAGVQRALAQPPQGPWHRTRFKGWLAGLALAVGSF